LPITAAGFGEIGETLVHVSTLFRGHKYTGVTSHESYKLSNPWGLAYCVYSRRL